MTFEAVFDVSRRYLAISAAMALILSLMALFAVPALGGEPEKGADQQGTVKIHEGPGEPDPVEKNEPKVCTFHIHGFNFHAAEQVVWWIEEWPGGDGERASGDEVLSGSSTADSDGEWRDPDSGAYTLPDGQYKLFVDRAPEFDPPRKHKVFKVECVAETTTTVPETTTTEEVSGTTVATTTTTVAETTTTTEEVSGTTVATTTTTVAETTTTTEAVSGTTVAGPTTTTEAVSGTTVATTTTSVPGTTTTVAGPTTTAAGATTTSAAVSGAVVTTSTTSAVGGAQVTTTSTIQDEVLGAAITAPTTAPRVPVSTTVADEVLGIQVEAEELPFTGFDTDRLIGIAVLLLSGGLIVLGVTGRREET